MTWLSNIVPLWLSYDFRLELFCPYPKVLRVTEQGLFFETDRDGVEWWHDPRDGNLKRTS